MGFFDGAETCELVGCYLLSLLAEKYGQNIGLYCDDGLAVFNKTPQEIEKIKKELCKIFRENGLREGTFFLGGGRAGEFWDFFSQKSVGPPLRFNENTPDPPPLGD